MQREKMKKKFVIAAAAAMIATAAQSAETPRKIIMPKMKSDENKEKCYGISKAGKNDCAWSGGSCHRSLTKDGDPTGWILMPKGLCERIVGGTLKKEG